MKKVSVLVGVIFTLVFVLSGVACSAGKKTSNVEGKLADKNSKPLAGVKVVATQEQDKIKGYEKIETKTKSDGTFMLKGLYPNTSYYLSFDGGQCNQVNNSIISAPQGETKILDNNIILKFSPFKKSTENVLIDPRTKLEWLPATTKDMTWENGKAYANSLSTSGGRWRLPSYNELQELYSSCNAECGSCKEMISSEGNAWTSEPCSFGARSFSFILNAGGCFNPQSTFTILVVRSPE